MVFDYCERCAHELAFNASVKRRLAPPCNWGKAREEAIDRLEARRTENLVRAKRGMKPLGPPDEQNRPRIVRFKRVPRPYGVRVQILEDAGRKFGLPLWEIKRIWTEGRRRVRDAQALISELGPPQKILNMA